MTKIELRDHAKEILAALSLNMETRQSAEQQEEKSEGWARVEKNSAASIHGTLRQLSSITLLQLRAEFRALRATVLRLWLPVCQR
jgi:hypothetical protein